MSQSPDTIVFTQFNILTDYGGYFTLNIPFFCQECGNCCKATSFPDPEHFESLIQNLEINISNLSKSANNNPSFEQNDQFHALLRQKPCFFLENDACQIYNQRPHYCREWFPRSEANCEAYDLHMRMSTGILKDQSYQIGIREVIYIGENYHSTHYPHVSHLEQITKETLRGYQSSFRDEIVELWEIFLSFNPSDFEKQIFLVLNPSLKNEVEAHFLEKDYF